MSSGLLYMSTSMIWKSMPFSYSTMRQRCENGSVVPEYRFIILAYLLFGLADEKGADAPRPRPLDGIPLLVHVLPELLVKQVRENEQREQRQHHDIARLLALQLIRFRHPGHEIDQVADQNVEFELRQLSGNLGLDRLQDEPVAVLAGLLGSEHVDLPGALLLAPRPLGLLEAPEPPLDQGLLARKCPQDVGHGDAVVDHVVPAGRGFRVAVEAAQVCIQPVRS